VTPDCMTPSELKSWAAANNLIHPRHRADLPCRDCPAAFAAEMRAEGRCNGTPLRAGRRRVDAEVPEAIGRGRPYATEELRRAARRRGWRATKARRRAAA
jgi:hypothetical protein